MRVDDPHAAKRMTEDAAMLGELEGLHGHAAAAVDHHGAAPLRPISQILAPHAGRPVAAPGGRRLQP